MIPCLLKKLAMARGTFVKHLRSKAMKSKMICRIRHEAMWLLHRVFKMSLPEVARALWLKNHTSVLYGLRRINRDISDRPEYEAELLAIAA